MTARTRPRALAALALVAAVVWTVAGRGAGPLGITAAARLLWMCAVVALHTLDWPAARARVDRALARFAAFGPWSFVALVIAVYVGCKLSTPRIGFGAGGAGLGYGHDGATYGAMIDHFAWKGASAPAPFNRRFLLPALVHALGRPVFGSFLVINSVSYGLSCLFVWKLVKSYGGSAGRALLAVALFASLKFGLKFWVYYPVLTDGAGMVFLLGAVAFAVAGRRLPYLAILAVGLTCRENLIVLVPFEVIRCFRSRATAAERAASLLAAGLLIAEFVLLVRHPIFQPTGSAHEWKTIRDFFTQLGTPDRLMRVTLAHLNSLGVLVALAWINRATLASLLVEQVEWLYFLAVHAVLVLLGGFDSDRFAIWYVPLLVVVLARAPRARLPEPSFWPALVLLQLGAMETFLPWARTEVYYFGRYATHCPPEWFGPLAAAGVLSFVAPLLMLAVSASRAAQAQGRAERAPIQEAAPVA